MDISLVKMKVILVNEGEPAAVLLALDTVVCLDMPIELLSLREQLAAHLTP